MGKARKLLDRAISRLFREIGNRPPPKPDAKRPDHRGVAIGPRIPARESEGATDD
jgi:hypothetical protein